MKDGYITANIDDKEVEFNLRSCPQTGALVWVYVFVPRNIELKYFEIVEHLINKGVQYVKNACPRKGKSPYTGIQIGYKPPPMKWVVFCTGVNIHDSTCRGIDNEAYKNFRNKMRKFAQAQRKKIHQERKKAEDESKRRQLARRKHDSKEIYDRFVKSSGIKAWPSWEVFRANPFIHEGKIVGLQTRFRTMISKDEGLFGNTIKNVVLVSNIPTAKFTKEVNLLLAGRVIGKEVVKIPLAGETLVPYLKFIDAYICVESNCDDILLWNR